MTGTHACSQCGSHLGYRLSNEPSPGTPMVNHQTSVTANPAVHRSYAQLTKHVLPF